MTNEIHKATPADAGCWIDGHWGQYGVARMVEIAAGHGYADSEVIDIASRHLASIGPSDAPELSADEWESLMWAADEVERWMTENIAPDGYSFEWRDGEFFLSPPETNPFADPENMPEVFGGVLLFAVMDDGGTLCETCVTDPDNPVHDERPDSTTATGDRDGWGVVGFATTDTVEDFLACDHCGRTLVTEPEEDDEPEDDGTCMVHGLEDCSAPECLGVLRSEIRQTELWGGTE